MEQLLPCRTTPRRKILNSCKDSEDVLQTMHEATESSNAFLSSFDRQSIPLKGQLISLTDGSIGTRSSISIDNREVAPLPLMLPDASRHAGAVISKIEDIFEHMIHDLGNDSRELVIHLKSRPRTCCQMLDVSDGAVKQPVANEAHAIRFPAKTVQEAWKFTVLLRILELSHEALVSGIVKTKRDIYYREPDLFLKQQVVDRYVDDLALTLGVRREQLNIGAAAKGLVTGHLTLIRKDGATNNCSGEKMGILIPCSEDIERMEIQGARWVLVVEKEATFRTLAASRFSHTSLAGKGILVTGKGYPDILTRAFLRVISATHSVVAGRLKPSNVTIFALTDFDPDGMAILSTYKHGSVSLAHENQNLIIPEIIWIGVKSGAFRGLQGEKSESCLKLTRHDRRKAILMLEKAVFQEEIEPSWRRELQVMLMLNAKVEIQILGGTSNLEDYISNELNSYLLEESGRGSHCCSVN